MMKKREPYWNSSDFLFGPKGGIVAKKALIVKAQRAPKFRARRYHRCRICGRPRGYLRRFAMCRICFRLLALRGEIPGITKSSW
jgi:small subunit ribosomal protein S14